ncbi:MAG: 30S ribosomal protein S17 [Planctomycetaceae bacterium]|nr:30S ribosomal protein S17 [Planctomycetaceae bacterium]
MRKTLVGVVTSDRNSKTRRVDVQRLFQHPVYKKIVRGRTICYVHDEENTSKVGDTVEIVESRPHSKTKRWELVRVVQSSDEVAAQLIREDQQEAKAAAEGNAAQ